MESLSNNFLARLQHFEAKHDFCKKMRFVPRERGGKMAPCHKAYADTRFVLLFYKFSLQVLYVDKTTIIMKV